jgi:hypothetical protein
VHRGIAWCSLVKEASELAVPSGRKVTRPVVALAIGVGVDWVQHAITAWETCNLYGPGASRECKGIVDWLQNSASEKVGMHGFKMKLRELRSVPN